MPRLDTANPSQKKKAHPSPPLLLLQNDDEDLNYVIAFFLGTAACLYQVSDGTQQERPD